MQAREILEHDGIQSGIDSRICNAKITRLSDLCFTGIAKWGGDDMA